MANQDAQAMAMAIEIQKKNRRRQPEALETETIGEPVAEPEGEATLEAPATYKFDKNSAASIARAIMQRHKTPKPAAEDDDFGLPDLEDLDEPKAQTTPKDRIASILARTRR